MSHARALLCLLLIGLVPVARAGHPLLSEDTGTQGSGNYELEIGSDWTRDAGNRNYLLQPQLSYGATASLDLIVQPSWIATRFGDEREKGFGDTNLDVKYRFFGAAPWSFGIRAGLELPTAEKDLGLPHGRVEGHGILVATADFTPFTVTANLGYARAPEVPFSRQNLYHLSAAITYAAGQRLYFLLDSAVDTNPDMRGGPYQTVALAGVIFTVRPGIDLDVGYREGLTVAAPTRQLLFGFTCRGAL